MLSAEIMFTDSLPPNEVWTKYGKEICISKEEFDEYTKGRSAVSAIGLKNVQPLSKDICLNTMREYEKNFQPPQFFSKLCPERALYSAFYA
ncbi:hypothetical protein L861_23290 [Litchfieldella anticariensis FP35 = DSM 16096]|uniref:Uncharacterized protein n=2 Tax=Litchfieldella anticariensis TaxID=258591 RepID=S2KM72_LITA3|nr:hypothetical protein L861_23290 [Halomonas anticariensis FP35 = DSM 16096]